MSSEEGACQRLSGGNFKGMEVHGHLVFSFAPPTAEKVCMKLLLLLILLYNIIDGSIIFKFYVHISN